MSSSVAYIALFKKMSKVCVGINVDANWFCSAFTGLISDSYIWCCHFTALTVMSPQQ
jgi:hypothetical protein